MDKLEAQLREVAIDLLEKREVSTVIGWGLGWNPAKATPVFARDKETASKLIFNPFCFNNLAVYLPRLNERTAIFTKACEAGSIVALLAEGKIRREDTYIVGVACRGAVDIVKLKAAVGRLDDATAAYLDGDDVVVEVDGETKRAPFAEVALDKCGSCDSWDKTTFCDVMIGEPVKPFSGEVKMTVPDGADAAWWREFWLKEFSRCLRCYACREACPACYCRDNCAAQSHREKWTGTRLDAEEALMFHALRAMHVAGRCIDCGACERACPVGIPLTLLHKEFSKAVKKLFDFKAGEKVDKRPPLETFRREELDKSGR